VLKTVGNGFRLGGVLVGWATCKLPNLWHTGVPRGHTRYRQPESVKRLNVCKKSNGGTCGQVEVVVAV